MPTTSIDKLDHLHPILVVEDCNEDFDTVVLAARRAKVANPLVHAASADAARRILAETSGEPFAFMLLDCSLPGEDGACLLHELRQHPRHGALPVIVLTASINPRDRNAFYAAGANAYHVKSVSFEDSLATLQKLFEYWLSQVVLPTSNALPTGKFE